MASCWEFSKRNVLILLGVQILSFLIRYKIFYANLIDLDTEFYNNPTLNNNNYKTYVTLDGHNRSKRESNRRSKEPLKLDKGVGCVIPKMNPFDKEIMQFDQTLPKVKCNGTDWVRCNLSKCKVRKIILKTYEDVSCEYQDLIYVTDKVTHLGKSTKIDGASAYTLVESDHVRVNCSGRINTTKADIFIDWESFAVGYRKVNITKPPRGRENTSNVLILAFDSTSKNGFIRRMPLSYRVLLDEINAVILNGYNIVGDGTTAALFPILTGKNELEMPDVRRVMRHNKYNDILPWIFYMLKPDGYRTAYFEDMSYIGTFQLRLNGWKHQPTDHYLRPFMMRAPIDNYCIGDTPSYYLMMKLTSDFFKLDGKKYCLTFISDINHDNFNMIQTADEDLVKFLRKFKKDGRLTNTLLIVMGDHGPRYSGVRSTYLGKLEERHPLMAIALPKKMKRNRLKALFALKKNVQVLTTPHDIYATVLDVMDMRDKWNLDKVPGADLTRGLTLLEPIPKSRTCAEAGVEPHWCTCMNWVNVSKSKDLYNRTAAALVDHINDVIKHKKACIPRYLNSIKYVKVQEANLPLLKFSKSKDKDGRIGQFQSSPTVNINRFEYTIKVVLGPGNGVYEASLSYLNNEDKFIINTRDIQRTNAYGDEPSCISGTEPHLNMFCYCHNQWKMQSYLQQQQQQDKKS